MTTLSTIIQKLYDDMGQIQYKFSATGGSATTIVNTDFANYTDPPDNETFVRNLAIVNYDAGGASASPEGKWSNISAYDETTYTLTVATYTDAVAAGDQIWIARQSEFPILSVIAAINRSMDVLGPFYFTDETSLDTVALQTEHDLPTGVLELLDLRIQGQTTDSNDNRWTAVENFRIDGPPATLASEPELVIDQMTESYGLQLHYKGKHPNLTAYNSTIYKFIPDDLLIKASIVTLLKSFLNSLAGNAEKHWNSMFAQAVNDFNEARIMHPIIKTKKRRKPSLLWPSV